MKAIQGTIVQLKRQNESGAKRRYENREKDDKREAE